MHLGAASRDVGGEQAVERRCAPSGAPLMGPFAGGHGGAASIPGIACGRFEPGARCRRACAELSGQAIPYKRDSINESGLRPFFCFD